MKTEEIYRALSSEQRIINENHGWQLVCGEVVNRRGKNPSKLDIPGEIYIGGLDANAYINPLVEDDQLWAFTKQRLKEAADWHKEQREQASLDKQAEMLEQAKAAADAVVVEDEPEMVDLHSIMTKSGPKAGPAPVKTKSKKAAALVADGPSVASNRFVKMPDRYFGLVASGTITLAEMYVLLALRRYCIKNPRECWVGLETLEKLTGMHRNNIRARLKGLEAKNIIKMDKQPHQNSDKKQVTVFHLLVV